MNPFIFHINLFELASMAILFAGLTLALLLGFGKRAGQTANLFLSSALVVIVLKTGGLTPLLLPALGPLLYFYVRQLTYPDKRFRWKDTLHFSLLLASYWMPGWLILISVLIYLYLAHQLIEAFYRKLRPVLMDRPRFAFRRLDQELLLLGLFCVLSLFNEIFFSAVALVMIGMAAEAILKPGSDVQLAMPITDRSDAREKGRRLKEAVAANRLFEDTELTLATLAVKLNIHPHDLSRIINVGLEKNFSDFINEFRVREVVRKMQDPAYYRLTLLGIAYESGFNSKTTFNRVFKEMTGKTPVEYKNSLNKEVPIDKLAPRSDMRPLILRSESPPSWAPVKLKRNYMFRNYLKLAWRNLAKQKGLSFISIFGLSLGIACFSLFALYAFNEFNFDGFHENRDNIYRVYNWREATKGSDATGSIYLPMPLGPAMKQDLPGVENYVRYVQPFEVFIKVNGEGRRENIGFADPSFFSVFSFKLKQGNPTTALKGLNDVVLTEYVAKKIFGKTDVVGKTFQIKVADKFEPFTVTGIAENPPSNSSLQISMLCNLDYWATTPEGKMTANNWHMTSYLTFVQLRPGNNLPDNKMLLAAFRKKYYAGETSPNSFRFGPLSGIHTDTRFVQASKVPPVDAKMIWMLLSIAAGVLVIACINFTTLAIGRSVGRAKEVGVRKVIGGTKKALAFQFLIESALLTVISTAIGLGLADLLLPFFNQLSGRELVFSFIQFPQLAWLVIALILGVSLLSGIYPALVLSRFNAVEVLKTKLKLSGSNFFTRSLVTFQFVLSAGLILSAMIIMQQLHYMRSKDPGFNKDNVLVVEALGIPGTKQTYPLLKRELASYPEIAGIASSDNGLGENEGLIGLGFDYHNKPLNVNPYFVDADYIPVLGMKLLAGRNFNPAIASDTVTSVIINEVMMNAMGLNLSNAVGQELSGYNASGSQPVVIGVVKNFNYLDLKQEVQPQMFDQFSSNQPFFSNQPYRFFVRIKSGDPANAIAALQSAWKKVEPDYPLRYDFLDEDLGRFYKSEKRLSAIIGWAGGISIFLACLGLFGLAALAAANRTKEIGIRKVLGASVSVLTGLIAKDFLRLVITAFVIAAPLSWYLMHKWLQDYTYRIGIEWWVFAATGVGIIGIALMTVSFQSIKAAMANPVKSLRSE